MAKKPADEIRYQKSKFAIPGQTFRAVKDGRQFKFLSYTVMRFGNTGGEFGVPVPIVDMDFSIYDDKGNFIETKPISISDFDDSFKKEKMVRIDKVVGYGE